MRLPSVLLNVLYFVSASSTQKIIDLSGSGWKLRNTNGSISVPAHSPSDQYLDLLNNGVIGDPLFGFNDVKEEWVQLSNWTYISPPIEGLGKSDGVQSWLVFEGLDTFTSISLCNKHIGSTNNQFRQWLFDVTGVLSHCHGEAKLSIEFFPAVPTTMQIANSSIGDQDDNLADSCAADSPLGCKVYARKEQNDFGWDWSPALVPAGPWRPIYVVQLEKSLYVNNALIDIYRQGQKNNLPPDQTQPWVFNASLDFVGDLPKAAKLHMTLKDSAGHNVMQTTLSDVYSSANTITGNTIVDTSEVELWWPTGMGKQALYTASIEILDKNGQCLTTVERRVGFRSIVLNQTPITNEQIAQGIAPGSNWHFEINGQEFYAKGSNFVPPSPFWPSVNETKIRQLFEFATLGNQNMLRVWASGAYLDDWIYDIADEMGILLWSEFEFSDAEYPNTTAYLQNYEAEVYYNTRRVNHHPSLALWAGGNELEAIIIGYFFNTTLETQYEQIFLELIIKCVYANTRSISYIPSSTYNGYLSLDFNRVMPQIPRYLNSSGPNVIYANTDYYNYDASQAFNLSSYPIGRFADEFGFHSMPSLQSWEAEAPKSDLYLESPTVVHHNRHYPFGKTGSNKELSLDGIAEMIRGVKLWYPEPDLQDSVANFTAWIYSTQVFQADFYQHEIAFYRRGSGRPERQLGSLYWMLEDLWAAPTWSSIDVLGRQKIVYYAAKDLFTHVIVYGYYNSTTSNLQVWVTSDLWSAASGKVTFDWMDFAGKSFSAPPDSSGPSFDVGAINSTKVLDWNDLKSTLKANGGTTSDAVLRLSVTANSAGKDYTQTTYFHPSSLAHAPLQNPGLKLEHVSGTSFKVTAAKAVAAWVWLDYTSTAVQGYWSDNGFWLSKCESKTVTFTVWNDWSGGDWIDTVSVRSLWDNK